MATGRLVAGAIGLRGPLVVSVNARRLSGTPNSTTPPIYGGVPNGGCALFAGTCAAACSVEQWCSERKWRFSANPSRRFRQLFGARRRIGPARRRRRFARREPSRTCPTCLIGRCLEPRRIVGVADERGVDRLPVLCFRSKQLHAGGNRIWSYQPRRRVHREQRRSNEYQGHHQEWHSGPSVSCSGCDSREWRPPRRRGFSPDRPSRCC